jgi:death-on-curing protein
MSWVWVDRQALELLHDESLAEHGGAPGLRDEGLLESAMARPRNLALYGDPDWAALAASYGIGLAKNHPFVDGNKRAALLATGMFLMINGYRLAATQAQATLAMMAVAAGEMTEESFAQWLRDHAAPRHATPPAGKNTNLP